MLYVFNTAETDQPFEMGAAVAEARYKWEPRVRLTRVQVTGVDPGHITMDLTMTYVIDGKSITITGLVI